MVIADVNIWVSAMRQDHPHHALAGSWLGQELAIGEIGWHPLLGSSLIRITTNAKIFQVPSTLDECKSFTDAVLSNDTVRVVHEGDTFWSSFLNLLTQYDVRGAKVSDMYWAALAIDNDATLCSANQGFARIKELKWHNLLA